MAAKGQENMRIVTLAVVSAMAAAAMAAAPAAQAGNPVGKYAVEGKNPDGRTTYAGTATVERTGDTYKVTWNIGGSVYVGTGIGDKNFLAVSYKSGAETGLALYGEEGDNWAGVWTYHNGRKVGAEMWSRQ